MKLKIILIKNEIYLGMITKRKNLAVNEDSPETGGTLPLRTDVVPKSNRHYFHFFLHDRHAQYLQFNMRFAVFHNYFPHYRRISII